MEALNKEIMVKALTALDKKLNRSVLLVVGGGGAMVLAHDFPLSTHDIDAVPKDMDLAELDILVKAVAKELDLPGDWLNPWFGQFAHNLPLDYESRLVDAFLGKNINAKALGKEDMLIMKCFAARAKDVPHARVLIKAGANTDFVEAHISSLIDKGIPQAKIAIDFFDERMDEV